MSIGTFILGFILAAGLYDLIKLGIKIGLSIYIAKTFSPKVCNLANVDLSTKPDVVH